MIEHNIEMINSAIRLGDRVVPPIGVHIRIGFVGPQGRHFIHDGEVMNWWEPDNVLVSTEWEDDYLCEGLDKEIIHAAVHCQLFTSTFTITYIPDDIPPFESWLRLGPING